MPRDMTAPVLTLSLGQYSSAGLKVENQDFHGALIPDGRERELKGITLAVADGISSSPVSAHAAETAVKSLLTDYYATPAGWTVKAAASKVISATNAWLYSQNRGLADINRGQVCTLSAMILKAQTAHIFHIGDSQVARLTAQGLEPLTTPHRHTVVGRSHLARALGIGPHLRIDYREVPLSQGDVFVLSTDGIHEFITETCLRETLASGTLDQAARRLTQVALDAGSGDNLTIQLARVEALPDPHSTLLAETLPLLPLPKPGDVIDGFTILRPFAQSARSHVFLAETHDGQKAVLKFPSREMADDPRALQRFMLEDWVLRRVASPHVQRALDTPEPRSGVYVASAYIEGQTLRQWSIAHPQPDLAELRQIADQIIQGLRAMHRRGMVHQDLRPENIMIDRTGSVRLIDLGSASLAGVEEAAPGVLGPLAGTFQYTAPEYLSHDPVSWRSDQFSLGVILYEMLTGRLPYGAEVAKVQSRRDQMRLRYQSARANETPVPEWIDATLRKATHPDPLKRYDALSEFMADLTRPRAGHKAGPLIPLFERNPTRVWQAVSAALACLCLVLVAR